MAEGVRTYEVTLTGKSPLILHHDDIEWADETDAWRKAPENQASAGKKGDDRRPAWTWIGCLYHDGEVLTIPAAENIMRCIRDGAAAIPIPKGRNGKTFKAQSQSGIIPVETDWPLLVKGKPVPCKPIHALIGESDFGKHVELAKKMGFHHRVQRAAIGKAQHGRVRPKFTDWSLRGLIYVTDDLLTTPVVVDIFRIAGDQKGLGDWRPSARMAPGPYGRCDASVREIKQE